MITATEGGRFPQSFWVPGRPATKGSGRAIRRPTGGTFMKPDNDNEKPWALAVAWCAKAQTREQFTGPLRVEINFYFPKPKKPTNPYPRGDVDKLLRSCLDAMTGIVWRDDSQVVEVSGTKSYVTEKVDQPGARIWIEVLP